MNRAKQAILDKIIFHGSSYLFVVFKIQAVILASLTFALGLYAQERIIVFQNIFTHKNVILRGGDEVHLKFIVHDTSDASLDIAISEVTLFGTIDKIGDSSFTLISKNKMFDKVAVNILVSSIDEFRKYSRYRPVMKVVSSIAAGALGLLVSMQIASSDQVFSWENAGFAVGTTTMAYMSRQLFSDRMKYFAAEGWRGKVITDDKPPNDSFSDARK